MNSEKLSNEDVWSIVENEGLGYAIQHYMSYNRIADPILAEKWKQAAQLLDEIDTLLDRCKPDFDDEVD